VSDLVEDDVNERLVKLETDVAHIRMDMGELKSEIKNLRVEIRAEMKDLRTEVRSEMTSMKDQMATIRVDMVMTRVWHLCTSAALLGVMARGFHWI
jgi:predicted  nucleic acid-binding Zn-ribbon protein